MNEISAEYNGWGCENMEGGDERQGEHSSRVMPTRALVLGAGRYDLHHAINYYGGYRQVL